MTESPQCPFLTLTEDGGLVRLHCARERIDYANEREAAWAALLRAMNEVPGYITLCVDRGSEGIAPCALSAVVGTQP